MSLCPNQNLSNSGIARIEKLNQNSENSLIQEIRVQTNQFITFAAN